MKSVYKYVAVLFLALVFAGAATAENTAEQTEATTFNQSASAWLTSIQTNSLACQRCGDGFCAAQCGENELTCPADCEAVDSFVSKAVGGSNSPATAQASQNGSLK